MRACVRACVRGPQVIKARDRHVRITWPSMRHMLLTVALSARTHARYMSLRYGGSYYITDTLEQVRAAAAPHCSEDSTLGR